VPERRDRQDEAIHAEPDRCEVDAHSRETHERAQDDPSREIPGGPIRRETDDRHALPAPSDEVDDQEHGCQGEEEPEHLAREFGRLIGGRDDDAGDRRLEQ
jgi:hypothetical protein